MTPPLQMKTSNTLNPKETYGSNGSKFNIDEGKVTVPQQSVVINPEFTVFDNPNIHNVTGTEAATISRETDYVNPSGDRTNIGKSVTDPVKMQASVQNNINTMLRLATSEKGQLEIETPDGKISVEGVSIQDLKQHNDLYPEFQVSSRPDPRTGFKTFVPYVTYENKPLNNEEFAYFVQNIAAPAIAAPKMDKGVVEYN